MTGSDAVAVVIDALDSAAFSYLFVGGFASNAHGIPRSTRDADFVIATADDGIGSLIRRLDCFAFDPPKTFDTASSASRLRTEEDGIPFWLDLFQLTDDPHERKQFSRRTSSRYLGRTVYLATAEDAIIGNLRWSTGGRRRKTVDDVRNVIAVQGDGLDWDYIFCWCDQHGTRALLEETCRSIPSI